MIDNYFEKDCGNIQDTIFQRKYLFDKYKDNPKVLDEVQYQYDFIMDRHSILDKFVRTNYINIKKTLLGLTLLAVGFELFAPLLIIKLGALSIGIVAGNKFYRELKAEHGKYQIFLKEKEVGGRVDYSGGLHSDGLGWNPYGKFCGECDRAYCDHCKNANQLA